MSETPRAGSASPGRIHGTATYRERMTLPALARLEVTLEDVSRADAPSTVIARTVVEPAGQPPLKFDLDYDPSALVREHRYAVRARVLHGDQLLFTTAHHHELPRAGEPLALALVRAGSAAPASVASLQNTYWKLITLGDTAVTVDAQREPHFVLHPDGRRVAGYGGCNRMTGRYELTGESLKFSRMAGTMMACPDGMQYEQGFHDALGRTARWKIEGEQLTLLDEAGGSLAKFESRYMH